MALINRFTSLLTADVHAVLDKIEDPLTSLKLAVREMEEALDEANKQNEQTKNRQRRLQQQFAETERVAQDLAQQLDVCFSSNEEELAKAVIRKKLMNDAKRIDIEKALTDGEAVLGKQASVVAENERRLAATREKLDLLRNESDTELATKSYVNDEILEPNITREAVDIAFLKEKQRRAK